MLLWQIESGADEAILDAPLDRYALDPVPAKPAQAAVAAKAEGGSGQQTAPGELPPQAEGPDPVVVARAAAAGAADLPALASALASFPLCDLQRGARNLVFADGQPGARLMLIGEAPSREEDRTGRPFVGPAGELLDRMLAAIGMGREAARPEDAVYAATLLPWRTPGDNAPTTGNIAMMLPFLERHIALANPEVIVLMGNGPCQALLKRSGINRLRGQWSEVFGRPALPMLHPAQLLQKPAAKREAWADLLALKARLGQGGA